MFHGLIPHQWYHSSLANRERLTIQDGNVIGGSFRLGFLGYTTATVSHDASSSELAEALAGLPSIDSVDVSRYLLLPHHRRV